MTIGRIYSITFSAVGVSAAQDLFEIAPADDKPVEILGIELGQTSDSGDAQDEQLQLTFVRGHSTSGSGGSSATPRPLRPNDGAAGMTAEVNNTTIASSGTGVVLFATAWNVRAGYYRPFAEHERMVCSQAEGTIVARSTAPADSLTMSGTLWVRELV